VRRFAFTIRTVHLDGTHDHLVAKGAADASYSPDGTRLAWSTAHRIVVRDLTTGTDSVAFNTSRVGGMRVIWSGPAFSPDNTHLAFVGYFSSGKVATKAYTVAVDGTDLQRLPISVPRYGSINCADWGASDRIAFAMTGYSKAAAKLFTIGSDGSNQTLVTTVAYQKKQNSISSVDITPCPSWSPDASQLAFPSNGGQLRSDVWIVNADGSGLGRLQRTRREWELSPIWSPRGTSIAVGRTGSSLNDQVDMFIVRLNGGTERRLMHTRSRDEYPESWMPRT
jgi:Tol biopolymer transport system component